MKTRLLSLVAVALLPCLVATAAADSFGSGDNAFDIEFLTIGNPGNSDDLVPDPSGFFGGTRLGSVNEVYRLGKYEMSRDMVTKANAEGNLGITLEEPPPFFQAQPETPATGVSWNEAARFVNWLNTSQGFPAAYNFTTQPGDNAYDTNSNIELWTDGDPGFDAANPFRNRLAYYFLPSVDEWHKAAYYDPNGNDGAGDYWAYPTGSDNPPTSVVSGTDPATAVFGLAPPFGGPAIITQAGGLSRYGTMAQGGNVTEWFESEDRQSVGEDQVLDYLENSDPAGARVMSNSRWNLESGLLASGSNRGGSDPTEESSLIFRGFRVASVPEPSALLLSVFGMLGLVSRRRRSR